MDDMKKSLVKGLTSSPKYIPPWPWYMYDENGSKIHDKFVVEIMEYYFSRSQNDVLRKYIKDMVIRSNRDFAVADLGCGCCSKTKYFLDELLTQQPHVKFFPLDMSKEFLKGLTDQLLKEYGEKLTINPIPKDYDNGLDDLGFRKQVVGIDTFSHQNGCNMKLYENSVARLNREEKSNFDLNKFSYKVDFVRNATPESTSYALAYIQAKEKMDVHIPGLTIKIHVQEDECIYFADGDSAGTSCKYTREQILSLTRKAGLQLNDTWTDEKEHVMFCRCELDKTLM